MIPVEEWIEDHDNWDLDHHDRVEAMEEAVRAYNYQFDTKRNPEREVRYYLNHYIKNKHD
jgi:hypothetical protein